MGRRFSVPYYIALFSAPVAAGLRIWTLLAGVDDSGLPVMALPTAVLIAAAAVYLILAVVCALRSPGRSGQYGVLRYGRSGIGCSMAAALMIGLGTILEFVATLQSGPGLAAPILAILGMVACIGMFVAAGDRRQEGKRHHSAEVLPVFFLLIKLALNFRSWSTDPIILDYCFLLFALIFALLAFFLGAGFVFDAGKPRQTLFFAMGAVFFCAAAVAEGLMKLDLSTAILYGGFLLWQLPMIWDLTVPSAPDPKPEKETTL